MNQLTLLVAILFFSIIGYAQSPQETPVKTKKKTEISPADRMSRTTIDATKQQDAHSEKMEKSKETPHSPTNLKPTKAQKANQVIIKQHPPVKMEDQRVNPK